MFINFITIMIKTDILCLLIMILKSLLMIILDNKLNINIINIVKSYLLPLNNDVKFLKYSCLKKLMYETTGLRTDLNHNSCFDIYGLTYCDNLSNSKIKRNIYHQSWEIRKKQKLI
jgi:hypothetical protein